MSRSGVGIELEVQRGHTNSVLLSRQALERAAALNDDLHIFVSLCSETAMLEAAQSDARRAEGRALSPLDGVPVAVKDNMAVAGLPTTCGTARDLPNTDRDATVVARLRAAGAVLIGTLNMHEGALGATGDNPFWGRCENPLQPGFTPGGSSSGSAAAVAAGIVPLTLGSDTMGSVRIPAAYCGLWGLKTTSGRLSSVGLTHLSWTLDSIGPLAQSPEDLALIMSVLDGPDPDDPEAVIMPEMNPAPSALSAMTLGVLDDAYLAECTAPVREAFDALLRALRAEGVTLQRVSIDSWEPKKLCRAGLLLSEAEGAATLGEAVDAPGLSDEFRAMLQYGRNLSAPKLTDAYRTIWQTGRAVRRAIDGLDGLLMPTVPQQAFRHGDPVPRNQADFTVLANAAGAPAICFPLAVPGGGLPASAQIMGPRGSDLRLIDIGKLIAAAMARV